MSEYLVELLVLVALCIVVGAGVIWALAWLAS